MIAARALAVRRFLVAACACVASSAALAVDYLSVGAAPAILYDAPTLRATKVSIAPRGMPLEVVVAQGDWVRVRDSVGSLAWVERRALGTRRTVVAKPGNVVDIHATADDASPVVFRVQPGVLLDLVGPATVGWLSVRHAEGQAGFVRSGSVWGG